MRMESSRRPGAGFTLIEMMAVLAIIAVLIAVLVPSMKSFGGARSLENTGQFFMDQWNLARQEAMARQSLVEFRIYQFRDKQSAGTAPEILGFQYFTVDTDGARRAISKPLYFPEGIVISTDQDLTSVVSLSTSSPLPSDPKIMKADGPYAYRSVVFRPDGSTDLSYDEEKETSPGVTTRVRTKHFITLRQRADAGKPPANYYTVLIESTTGRTKAFRP